MEPEPDPSEHPEPRARRLAREARWAAAIVAAAIAPAVAVLAAGRTIVWRDTATLFGPVRPLVEEALRRLELPLWNPHEAFGVPLLAQVLHAPLHPVSVLAAWLAPGAGMEPLLLAHFALAALGAAVLARVLGAGRAAAAAAGFAYGLSGYVLGMSSVVQYLGAAATAPWAVAGLALAGSRGARGVVLAGLGVGALHLAGDPQWTAIAAALGLALAAEAGLARGAARALAGLALGTALAGVQLVTAWSYLPHTLRAAGISAADRAQWALAPARLLELVAPGFFAGRPGVDSPAPVFMWLGGPTQSKLAIPFVPSVFVGAAVLALALAGWRSSRRGRVLTGASLVLLWLALGVHAGADQALRWVPVWGSFRYAEKMVGPLTLCLALLAAAGVERLAAAPPRRLGPGLLAGGGAIALAAAVLLALPAGGLGGAPAATVEVARVALAGGLLHAAAGLVLLGALVLLAHRGQLRRAFPALAAGLVLVAALAASPYALRAGRRDLAAPPLALQDRAGAPMVRYATPIETPPFRNPLALDSGDLEVAFLSRLGTAPFNVPWRIDQASIYSGVPPRTLRALGERFGPDLWAGLRRFGLTHVVVRAPADEDEMREVEAAVDRGTPVHADEAWGITVWRVPHRPWAFFAERTAQAVTDEQALEAMLGYDLAGLPTVVVQGPAPAQPAPGRVLRVERERERLRIEAEAAGDGLLVVNDAFWPGWRATIDGAPVEVLRADFLVRAVAWPAGRHTLELRYEPPEARLGLLVSAAGALALALVGLVPPLAARSRRRSGGETAGHDP